MKSVMEKLKKLGMLMVLSTILAGCQLNLPFNNASKKLVEVAESHEISPNEEIVIGEFHDKGYKVYIDNKAKSPVIVYTVDRNTNLHTQTFRLDPNNNATIIAAKFEKVVFQNPSGEPIKVEIGLKGDVEGWRTQPMKEYKSE